MATTPAPRKSTARKPAAPAPVQTSRTEAEKLASCFSQAMRLTAALKRSKLADLSDEVFMIAAQLKTLEKAAKDAQK